MGKIYKTTEYSIENLLNLIETGKIGLPDLQRPFVWKTSNVRDLFDSLYRGYPVGFFLFWETKNKSSHNIGIDNVNNVPDSVIIDGQQRLTSLYATIKGKEVLDEYFKPMKIILAFNPLKEKIEVSTPAYEKSSEWIENISMVWLTDTFTIITNYYEKNSSLSENEKIKVRENIQKLFEIKNIGFTALEIVGDVGIEQVSEIFVRINSEGKKLNQLDFILTLLSVYWDEGRKEIEIFAYNLKKKNNFTHLLTLVPGDIIKVLVSFTFYKGRLKDIYNLLKGRDTEERVFKEELRLERLEKLKQNLPKVLNLGNWNDFFKILIQLGFKNSKTINASNNILFSYIFYLIGKYKFNLEYYELGKYIGKYYVYLVLTAKYSSSTETTLEKELKIIEKLNTKQEFIDYIENEIQRNTGDDFWNFTFIDTLANASVRNNGYLVYLASKIKNNTKVLFSDVLIGDLLDDKFELDKKFLDIHHIFPKNYLKQKYDITDRTKTNQLANYVYINYKDNIKISDKSPEDYYNEFVNIYGKEKIEQGLKENDIPLNFYEMDYEEFLEERRKLMRDNIKEYFDSL